MTVLGGARQATAASVERDRTRRQIQTLLALTAIIDLALITAAILVAWDLRLNLDVWTSDVDPDRPITATVGPWILIVWMTFLFTHGAYSVRVFGAGSDEYKLVYLASLITAGTVGMGSYLLQLDLSRGFVVLTFMLGAPMLIAGRYTVRKLLHRMRVRGKVIHRVVAVGGPSAIRELADVMRRERYAGYEICGACVPRGIPVDEDEMSVSYLGEVADTRRVCEEMAADTVLVARGGYSSAADLRRIAWDLEDSDIDLVVVPSLTDVAGPRIHMRPVAGLPLLHVEAPQTDEAGGMSKRLFDVVGSLLGIIAISPLLLAVALLVKLEDGGPVLFRQTRIGRDGIEFGMMKFRSMVPDAEERLEDIRHLNESDGVLFKVKDDPRITRIGRFLRRYSIDELPQLFNVLKGDMSLVGPRPPLRDEVDAYEKDVRRRLLVRPGMTGLWQVSGRSSLSWSEAVRLDLYYVDNWSMLTDAAIIAKTVKAVVGSQGAY
ncbi:MAG TPA: sugar transferase [Nocardioidaceae bacterium]|nr:sugar transferase [Nocardioidaceae bacterium]